MISEVDRLANLFGQCAVADASTVKFPGQALPFDIGKISRKY